MAALDRVHALLEGRPVDRVPVYLFAASFGVTQAGYPLPTVYDDPRRSLEAQLCAQALFGYDSPPYYAYATYGTWERGEQLAYPSSELRQEPTMPFYPVRSEEEAETLELPDVTRAGMLPRAMQFSRLQAEHGLPVSVVVGGVFAIAGNICGLHRLLVWMVQNPGTVHHLLQMAGDHLGDIVEHWAMAFGAGRLLPVVWESLATSDVISPACFEEFVLPYQKQFHERILATGVEHILCHICGEQRRNLPHWAAIPMGNPGIVSIGHEIDLEEAGRHFPKDILMGNIEPALVDKGTPEQVYRSTWNCIQKGKKHRGGFILAAGCELAPETPPDNVRKIMQAVNDVGRQCI